MPKKQGTSKSSKDKQKTQAHHKHDPLRTEANKRRKQAKHAREAEIKRKAHILRRAAQRLEQHFLREEQKEALLLNRMTYHQVPATHLLTLREQMIKEGKITPLGERKFQDHTTSMNNPLHTQH